MARKSNRERWVEAMSRIACSLIGEAGLQRRDALIVCRCYREKTSRILDLKRLETLESEAAKVPPIPDYILLALDDEQELPEEQIPQPSKKARVGKKPKVKVVAKKPTIDSEVEYPAPWVKVKNQTGTVIRYEDSKGRNIPEVFWPT